MTSSYHQGRNFEYRVRDELQKQGYVVDRSMMSREPFDLKAKGEGSEEHPLGELRLIQCKKTATGYMRPEERKALLAARIELQAAHGECIVTAEVAYPGKPDPKDKRRIPVIFKEVNE